MAGILAKPNQRCQVHSQAFCNEAEGVPASSRGFRQGPTRLAANPGKFAPLMNEAIIDMIGAGPFRYPANCRWLGGPEVTVSRVTKRTRMLQPVDT